MHGRGMFDMSSRALFGRHFNNIRLSFHKNTILTLNKPTYHYPYSFYYSREPFCHILQRLCKSNAVFNLFQYTCLGSSTNGAFTFHAHLIIPNLQYICLEPRINLLKLFKCQRVNAHFLLLCKSDTGSTIVRVF